MSNDFGILSYGAYIPRLRLQRKSIAAANSWFAPGLRGLARGERAMANWDEDVITMAVEASRSCLQGRERSGIDQLTFASTTFPYADRQNAGVVATALNLGSSLGVLDVAGSQRAGAAALATAFDGEVESETLVIASEKRKTKAASTQEMHYGDGAAAILVGRGKPVARLIASRSETVDFVDHFRGRGFDYDYGWEERWIREEGYQKIVPRAVAAALEEAGVSADSITHFCMPCTLSRTSEAVAKRAGIRGEAVRDNLAAVCGDTGTAHSLLMLAHALEDARPGDRILVAAFGQGCEVLVLEVTEAISDVASRERVSATLARRKEEPNYQRLLAFNHTVDLEHGMRSEMDKITTLTSLYRNRETVMGLIGGRCRHCGTLQFPRGRYCVNPECNALDSQDQTPFSDTPAAVMTYTADSLTYSPNPPHYYGMVTFEGGGRLVMDFADVDEGVMEVGLPMRMMFRVKDYDRARGFARYFWKAAPALS